ncbi:hypothetical protein FNV43_RR05871 [Rhamnella rubrinervis]|uniref:Uncharacterized protein n=2 Tax=rosids TaxID=71275 RepID=A0A8K0HCU7_9ROSA|nr:hypothetical protein FNV43_RR05871 [Rhamnella rubrinervis]
MKIDGGCLIELIGSCRNKVQVYRSVRMPQLHTSLHFHLTPIVMINGSSRRDLLLNSQNFCRSTPAGAENPSLSWLCYRKLWGSRNRRALILGWAYYLDAFSSYPLRTWLPSVYRGHDNCPTLGTYYSPRWRRADIEVPNLPVDVVRIFTDMSISPSLSPRQCPDRYAFRAGRNLPDKEFRYLRTVIVTAAVHRGFGRRLPCHQVTNFLDLPALGRRQPPYMVLRLCGDLCFWYPFVEGRSSFSWEYGMGYFSAVAPGPDSPSVDEPCGGTLRFSGHWILTNVCVTQADILASASSTTARAGALAGDPGCFPLDDEAYPPSSHWPTLTPVILSQLLRLNAFRGEPASSGFEWHFTPNHNSSADSSTSVGSDLHLVSPKLHPGHG